MGEDKYFRIDKLLAQSSSRLQQFLRYSPVMFFLVSSDRSRPMLRLELMTYNEQVSTILIFSVATSIKCYRSHILCDQDS